MNNYPAEVMVESFKYVINRSKGWTLALGWVALVYGLLSIIRVAVSTITTFSLIGVSSWNYPFMMSAGTGIIGLVVCLMLIPLGVVLIRAEGNLKAYLANDDFSSIIVYHQRLRTSTILAVTVLIIDILSVIVMALFWGLMAMSSFSLIGD